MRVGPSLNLYGEADAGEQYDQDLEEHEGILLQQRREKDPLEENI